MKRLLWNCLSLAFGLCLTTGAWALTIDAKDRGWYDSFAFAHDPANTNYATGDVVSGLELRSFFVFDLSGVSGTVTSATLRILNPAATPDSLDGYFSVDPTETFDVKHVGTSSAALIAGTAGAAGFADLADGFAYAAHLASAADNGTFVMMPLNAFAIADIMAAFGGDFSVGGSLSVLDKPGATELFFAFTGVPPANMSETQLILEGDLVVAAPEPASLALLALGMLMLATLRLPALRRARAANRTASARRAV